jgi:transitional endoplasmic reticulum ATPase
MTKRQDASPNSSGGTTAADRRSLTLRVGEALSKDVGRALARIDPEDLKKLGISIGDVVAITGKKTSFAKAMPALKEQRGLGLIQLDGLTRANIAAGIDDTVTVTPATCREADSVTLQPTTVTPGPRDMEYIGSLLDGLPVTVGDRVRAQLFGSRSAEFIIERTNPATSAATASTTGAVLINPSTQLLISGSAKSQDAKASSAGRPTISYEDVGGLKSQVSRIREMIELPLKYPEVFERLGIDPPKGVLLHGPPGCGKTLIARAIAHETDANFFSISGPEIVHKFYGESEAHLRKIWDEATKKGPSIIFLDEIDSIAPKRENAQGEVEKRIVAQLLALMDGLNRRANVMVIAATNLPNNIDPALRRPGRFDREIAMPIPDRAARRHILEIHSRGMPLAQTGDHPVDLDHLADITHGYVGADLEALCREAAMAALRTIMGQIDFKQASIPYATLQKLEVTMEHFLQAYGEIEPSAVREVFVETPNVKWDDIGGLAEAKQKIVEAVEWPLKHKSVFDAAGIKAAKGILLVGPPGVGKTMLAKAIANESQANFISVKGPELISKFVGDSEKQVREIFRKARRAAPCIIFFDEIDAVIPNRSSSTDNPVANRVLSQFLSELDGVEELNGVLVLGATNRLDMLDAAMIRPGRFDHVVELGVPDEASRAAIYEIQLRGKPVDGRITAADLARRSPGASGAQIAGVVQKAAMLAVRRAVAAKVKDNLENPLVLVMPDDFAAALADEFGA